MTTRTKLDTLMAASTYAQKNMARFGSALVAYWKLGERAGTVALDARDGYAGTHLNVTLGQPGIGDGATSAGYNGLSTAAGSLTDVYRAALAAAFPYAAGSVLLWFKVSAAGIWTDGANRELLNWAVDGQNYLLIRKSSTNNTLDFRYKAGNVTQQVLYSYSATTWTAIALTWSRAANEVKAYLAGSQIGTTQVGVAAWVGTLAATTTTLGATDTAHDFPFSGTLQHVMLLNRVATPAEVLAVATGYPK